MRALIRAGIVCAGIVYATSTWAEPRIDVRTAYQRALKLANSGAAEQALAVIKEGLVAAPRNLPLLGLKGTVLLSLYDHAGALAAYQVYLDTGARGANRREAQKIVDSLRAVQSTFIEVTVADAPATILVAFSCKRRGICPSCTARRMADTAAYLVDRVLPSAPYRQWVLSLPAGGARTCRARRRRARRRAAAASRSPARTGSSGFDTARLNTNVPRKTPDTVSNRA